MIREPSAAEIAAAKVEASKRFGRSDVVGVLFQAPIGVRVIASTFDRAAWHRFVDLCHSRPADVAATVWAERVVWPPPADAEQLASAWAAVPGDLCRKLKEHAGEVGGAPRVEPLTALGAPGAGLSTEAATKLLEGDRALWVATIPRQVGGKVRAFVLEAPDPARYEAAVDARTEATNKGEGILASSEQLVLESVRWPSDTAQIVERWPGLIGDLWSAFARAGGFGLASECKSL